MMITMISTAHKTYRLTILTVPSLCLALITTGCQSEAANTKSTITMPIINNTKLAKTDDSSDATNKNYTRSQQASIQQAQRIQRALANKNYASITNDIHPIKGIRFSMYAYVQPSTDKVFTRKQYAQYLIEDKIRFTWGAMDGTGELLIVPLPIFLDTHIRASKFDSIMPTINQFEARGNTINNINKIYPNADIVEFYKQGSDKYAGMDWRAMRLVFEKYRGKRYLVGIVSDQWTI